MSRGGIRSSSVDPKPGSGGGTTSRVLMVVRREYLQSVKTKMFWIGTLILPLGMMLMIGLSVGAQFINPETRKTLALVDATGRFHAPLTRQLAGHLLKDGSPEFILDPVSIDTNIESTRKALEPQVLDGELYGIVTIGDDLNAEDNYRLFRKSVGDEETAGTLRSAISDAAIGLRLERSRLDLDRDLLERLVSPIGLETYQVTEGQTRKKGFEEDLIPTFAFVLILFFTLYFYGFTITRGIIQEKSNRIMEVLLGSLSPEQLMTGKILGIGLVGLTQVAIYALVGGALRAAVSFLQSEDLFGDALATSKLVFFLIFFVLGYFLFASLFAMVGAVCNTEQDAQSLQFPVMMALMLPYVTTFFFVKHPDSTAAVVASFIPLFTPMVMFMRISVLTPPAWQIALSIVITAVTIYLLFRAAAKVFRIGTLMYGKRPTIPEIWRWARS